MVREAWKETMTRPGWIVGLALVTVGVVMSEPLSLLVGILGTLVGCRGSP